MLPRAAVLLILGFAALPGCNRDGVEGRAIAARGAGAVPTCAGKTVTPPPAQPAGVSFEVRPSAGGDARPPLPWTPEEPLLDPFADPPTTRSPDGTPGHRRRGISL